jgi:DNA-binding protein HU-beta
VLLSKEEVKLGVFGKFVCTEKAARKGRNPKTGEDVDIPAKTVVKFKAGKAVKDLF